VGILIRNRLGIDVFGTNTRLEARELGEFHAGDRLEVEFRFDCLLAQQEYTLTAATQYFDGSSQDWLDDAISFQVVDPSGRRGSGQLPYRHPMPQGGRIVTATGATFFGHPRGLATLFFTEMWSASATTGCVRS